MSLWRGICYDTVSVKLILINFKVHVFIWWLSGETLNWGWLGLFFCWLNIVVWKQRSRSDEQAPPVLPNTVSFPKKSHRVPPACGELEAHWPKRPQVAGSARLVPGLFLSKTRQLLGALEILPPIFPGPCGCFAFFFLKTTVVSRQHGISYIAHHVSLGTTQDGNPGRIFFPSPARHRCTERRAI